MPPTQNEQSWNAKFILDNPYHLSSIASGDIITGRFIVIPSHKPFTRIRITLSGVSKTKVTETTTRGSGKDSSRHTDYYYGSRTLFEISQIFDSQTPLSGTEEYPWNFSIQVPFRPVAHGEPYPFEEGYLSSEDVSQHGLPSTFYFTGIDCEATVEYVLRGEAFKDISSKKPKYSATLPLRLKQPAAPFPITDFGTKFATQQVEIKTLRLIPGNEDRKIKTREKLKGFFQPSTLPKHDFKLKVTYPSIIQLNHPEPISLLVSLIPDQTPQSDTKSEKSEKEEKPPIRIISLDLSFRCFTSVRGKRDGVIKQTASKEHKYYFETKSPFLGNSYNLPYPSDSDPSPPPPPAYSSSSSAPPIENGTIDIGKLLGLRLTPTHAEGQGIAAVFDNELASTFGSYNITVSYGIRWKIGVECRGEKKVVSNKQWFMDPCLVLDTPAGF